MTDATKLVKASLKHMLSVQSDTELYETGQMWRFLPALEGVYVMKI
jgi:hypothetical protein